MSASKNTVPTYFGDIIGYFDIIIAQLQILVHALIQFIAEQLQNGTIEGIAAQTKT